jgi:hypothetical protein
MPDLALGLMIGEGDAQAGVGPAPSTGFNIDVRDTHSNILARSGDAVGVIAFGTDTHDLYVYDGANWQQYINAHFNIDVRLPVATIMARSGDAVGVIAYGTDTYDLYVYDGTDWQRYLNT